MTGSGTRRGMPEDSAKDGLGPQRSGGPRGRPRPSGEGGDYAVTGARMGQAGGMAAFFLAMIAAACAAR